MSFAAIVGGQFGSEGKGLIAGHVARDYQHHVRVGAANAGHTVYTQGDMRPMADSDVDAGRPVEWVWEKHVMQQIPCAAYANPHAKLYIGPGAQISNEIFQDEMTRLFRWRRQRGLPDPQVYMDPRAHVIGLEHIEREQESGLAERIGSTSTIAREGIGAAQAARVMRDETCIVAKSFYGDEAPEDVEYPHYDLDVPMALAGALKRGENVLLEGTQGTGLSLTTGFFPYTTSRNTTAAGLCADAGLPPGRLARVILVCRTYPIRVAGPSGPFHYDSVEIDWEQLGIDPENERTTVTKKVRRVATFSMTQIVEAAAINGATEIALTFADYLDPGIAGVSGTASGTSELMVEAPRTQSLIDEIEVATGVPVRYVGTGPHSVIEMSSHATLPHDLRAPAHHRA
jgi:adenylosuccinate synthase